MELKKVKRFFREFPSAHVVARKACKAVFVNFKRERILDFAVERISPDDLDYSPKFFSPSGYDSYDSKKGIYWDSSIWVARRWWAFFLGRRVRRLSVSPGWSVLNELNLLDFWLVYQMFEIEVDYRILAPGRRTLEGIDIVASKLPRGYRSIGSLLHKK